MATLPGGDEGDVDPDLLLRRALHYADKAGVSQSTSDKLASFLRHPVTLAILALPPEHLNAFLLNDAYKPRMHKLYARYMPAVLADFQLSVRRTPLPLAAIQEEDPELWARFQRCCAERLAVAPYPPPVVEALRSCFDGFVCSEAMLARAEAHGVAALSWLRLDGELVAFAHGPIEASSHVETTLTQLVQAVTLAGQMRRLQRQEGVRLTATELLAAALGKLAAGVARLAEEAQAQAAQAGGPPPPVLALFAGRRSSSRRYLLLQNWYCLHHLPHYACTSSVFAVLLLRRLLRQQAGLPACGGKGEGESVEAGGGGHGGEAVTAGREEVGGTRLAQLRLVGTLAHEVVMVTDQLLGCYDNLHGGNGGGTERGTDGSTCDGGAGDSRAGGSGDVGGGGGGSPAQICALLAHLLLLAAGGGLAQATALPDTFGTPGFVAAALAAALPQEFREDMQEQYPGEWAALPAAARADGARVFDLFAWWRLDSGDYAETAALVMDAWERRWAGVAPARRPPPPRLMHSNLDSYDEVVAAWRLPPRIRPAALAFGTLADGFPALEPASAAAPPPAAPSGALGAGPTVVPAPAAPSNGGAVGVRPSQQAQQAQQAQQPRRSGEHAAACRGSRGGGGDGSASGGAAAIQLCMCSVVMKAVQARHAGGTLRCSTESAGKLGDDASRAKALFDRRLPAEAIACSRARLSALAPARQLDPASVSAALSRAYHAVTRERVLC